MVDGLDKLNSYPLSGHSVLRGRVSWDWQESESILVHFGTDPEKARAGYESFVKDGIAHGRRPELVSGGLVRSLGNWSQVLSFRRKGETFSSVARVLGGVTLSIEYFP